MAAAATARAVARESLDEKVAALCTDLDHAAVAACSDPALLVDGLGMTVEERAKLLCRTCQKAPGDKSSQELFHEGFVTSASICCTSGYRFLNTGSCWRVLFTTGSSCERWSTDARTGVSLVNYPLGQH